MFDVLAVGLSPCGKNDILSLLEAYAGSYIEWNGRAYRIVLPSGECLAAQELWCEHVNDLVDTGRIVHRGRSCYVVA